MKYNRRIKDSTSVFDTYLELVELTEPPLLYHRWSFISILAAALGRSTWLPFGEENIYPNHFINLIGPPGARKSTAIKIATSILQEAGYEYFTGDRSSKEKFLLDWEHGFDKINRGIEPGDEDNSKIGDDLIDSILDTPMDKNFVAEAYIKAGELEDFLGSGNANFISTLTNLWDNPPKYTDRFKNSKSLMIPNPTVNMIGGATTTTFASIFSSNIIGQGMLSRLILVYGKGQRMKLTIPPPLPAALRSDMVKLVNEIRLSSLGPMTLTDGAYKAVEHIYTHFEELPDSRLATYSSRRLTHLLKLCIILRASELETEITEDTVVLANSILSYTEVYMPKALGEFGKSKSSEVSQIVLDAIDSASEFGGISLIDLLTLVSQDVDSVHELSAIVQKLKSANKVDFLEVNGKKVLKAVKRKFQQSDEYLDMSLLWEYRLKEAE